jgi:hypothetical protein
VSREILVAIGWTAGVGVAVFLAWTLWWALFSDRSRGARRCPKCWHVTDMGNAADPNLRCQECGHLASHERELLGTRRKWMLAALCVIGLCAETVWVRAIAAESGWWSLLPDRALLPLTVWLGDGPDARAIRASLRDRLVCGRVDPADVVRLFTLAREGDPDARPGSARWRERYLPWVQALHGPGFWNAYAGHEAVRDAATSVPPDITASLPSRWWSGTPLPVTLNVEDGLPDDMAMRIELVDVEGVGLDAAARAPVRGQRWRRQGAGGFGSELPVLIGAPAEGEHLGELRLRWTAVETDGKRRSLATGEVRVPLPVHVDPTLAPLVPRDDPESSDAIRAAFEPGLLRRRHGDRPRFAFSYRPGETGASALRDTAFGLVVEACEDGVPRRTLRVWWRGGSGRSMGWERPIEDRDRLLAASPGTQWTLRIRGDEALARRAAEVDGTEPATRWWSGSVELPLQIQDLGSDQRMQRWVPEPPGP